MEPTAGATRPPSHRLLKTYLEKHRTFPRTADRRNLSRVSRVYAGANQLLFFRLLLEHSRCGSAEQLRGKRNAALKSGLVDECWLWVTKGKLDMLLCSLDYALRTRGSTSSHRQYLLWVDLLSGSDWMPQHAQKLETVTLHLTLGALRGQRKHLQTFFSLQKSN